ncbi:MAG: lipoyl synthase [Elusimicrobia bacterium]|nr:lipoyl synthase [Elusimicrobiota bacterium]
MRFPAWILEEVKDLKRNLRDAASSGVRVELAENRLHTVCQEALCPNKGECFSHGEATFLILGDACTRNCGFCAVSKKKPIPPDPDEPKKIAELARKWNLKYAVFTSPTRDDLSDGGAEHFAQTITKLKNIIPEIKTEPLVPDFKGSFKALETVLNANPDVFGHNIETVPSNYEKARKEADYRRSLNLIKNSKKLRSDIFTKSGLILGLGETDKEIENTLNDLREHEVDLLTMGQYLAPSKKHLPVEKYYTPEEFKEWGEKAKKMGFKAVLSGPLVRSSYKAGYLYEQARKSIDG